jgi:hypothetical protein
MRWRDGSGECSVWGAIEREILACMVRVFAVFVVARHWGLFFACAAGLGLFAYGVGLFLIWLPAHTCSSVCLVALGFP